MKKKNQMQTHSIFFFFLLLVLLKSNIESFLITNLAEPKVDESLEIINQNLKTELTNLQTACSLEKQEENSTTSRTIFRDPYSFFDTITILKGIQDGISQNSAVLNGKYLIGLITEVNQNDSIVTLLSSENSKISVKIKDAYGVMTTNKERECWVTNLSKTVEVEKGDVVTTSGLTSYPAEIIVGTVEEIKIDKLGLRKEIKVSLMANLNEIVYVTIMGKETAK